MEFIKWVWAYYLSLKLTNLIGLKLKILFVYFKQKERCKYFQIKLKYSKYVKFIIIIT